MSSQASVTQEIEDLMKEIIVKHKLNPTSEVSYTSGSELGDGYLSKSLAASITSDEGSLELFLKCALDIKSSELMPLARFYAIEMHFYNAIYPAYVEFLKEKGVEDGFRNVPICYGTSTLNIIAMENLKKKGFILCDRTRPLNGDHITLALKTFAKFHAISFAMKDQKKDVYKKLIEPLVPAYDIFNNDTFVSMRKLTIDDFLKKLNPVMDKITLDGSGGLADKLENTIVNSDKIQNEYSILTQGDCWCNNMLFLYQDEKQRKPIDIMLLDWQLTRSALPVFDISYFFYTVASEEALAKVDHYLIVYHEELSRQIRKLGSDPDILYPLHVLKSQWKEHGKFGFSMAFMLLRIMLTAKDEVVTLEEIDLDNIKPADFQRKIQNDDEYIRRLKVLTEFMVANGFV